ncbi:hypothetical protein Rhopal_005328-T1 [Rhodotorula paludigena]|uniref:Rhodanese domain-containing protein n=1 Tax=Rhodotorula paludigena TaxID=86838 RepID=A0AAV5GQ48_9BASI|nr:hypothetical protein Rhopal_005328-T1 [Rhodotorula paludigena]
MSLTRTAGRTAHTAARSLRVCAAPAVARPTSSPLPLPLSSRLAGALPLHRYNPVPNDKRWTQGAKVSYDELKPLTQSPSDKILLIDVREPEEVALGSIPSSVNLPLSSFEKSLSMDEGDFTRVHGFRKPTKNQPMIFYCKAGVRAQTAVDLARSQGFKLARNYEGSYNDWVAREGNNQDD